MPLKQVVINEALQLPEADRLDVAEALYQSVEGSPDADAEQAWSEEIARRIEGIDAGEVNFLPLDEARRKISED